ncbi:MAG: hypothetical protein H0S80_06390 [Desulfovibrionaceae bacterium]|nr:hypothetical protein [Desulfovibrionaceae bacterium]
MHAHFSVPSTGRHGRFALFAAVLFLVLVEAAPVMAQDLPAGGRTGGMLNILLLAVIAYFLVRSFRRRNRKDDTRPGRWTPTDTDRADPGNDEDAARPMDRHEAARRTWDILSSKEEGRPEPTTPTGPPPQPRADGFDEAEFLEGAKLFFSRFQQARADGGFDDLREFMSDDVFREAEADGRERIEVMLLTARLVELNTEGGRTTATVFYDARLRTGEQGERNEHVRQVWEFSRDDGRPDALWILEKMDKVDQ